MMNFKDYYSLLKIDRNATEEDIKKAYRKQAMAFHPDVNTNKDAEETFKKISEAYAVLRDRQKRYIYDQTGATNFTGFGTTMNRPYPRGRGMGRCMGGMRMGKCSSFENIYRRRPRYANTPPEPPDSISE